MSHDHIAKRPNRFVKPAAFAETQRLRYVDLHVVDEVAIPDRLEESVGETERENILRRFLAKKVVDPEDLLLAEYFVQAPIQRHCTREVGAEWLFHDDPRALDEVRLAERPYRRQRRAGRHA